MTTHEVEIPTQPSATAERSVAQLARQIVAVCHRESGSDAAGDGLISVPSERELSAQLRVARHTVRNALAHLQREGLLRRPGGRGAILVSRSVPTVREAAANNDLACINLIFSVSSGASLFQWQRDLYMAGYTEAMEHQACKVRYMTWRSDQPDFDSVLWCHAAPRRQACLLVNVRDATLMNWLGERGVPFAVQNYCLYDYHALPPHHKVYVNKAKAAFEATQQLIEWGHRNIGFVGSMPRPNRSWPEYDGYQAAMKCAGFPPNPEHVVDINVEIVEQAKPVCRALLERAGRPTAVVAGNGATTLALLESAQELGIEVPDALSLIGFDDEKTPAYPHVSTIAVPRHQLGREAMDLLLDAVSRPDLPPQTRVIECRLNYQETTGPVPEER